jgi:uncharacterized protein
MYKFKICWDLKKTHQNLQKHGISFEEAKTVLWDENAIVINDPDHSIEEDRYILLGQSAAARLLVVVHCYRENDTIVRIISARKATKNECLSYQRRWL